MDPEKTVTTNVGGQGRENLVLDINIGFKSTMGQDHISSDHEGSVT